MQVTIWYDCLMPDVHNPDNTNEGTTMTAQEAADLLGVSRPTITRMVKDGRLVPVDPPKKYLKRNHLFFRREDIERLAAQP